MDKPSGDHWKQKNNSNLEDLLLLVPLLLSTRRPPCGAFRIARLRLRLTVELRLKLDSLLRSARRADVVFPPPLHLTALRRSDIDAVAMEPVLAFVTADHEPTSGNKKNTPAIRKRNGQMVEMQYRALASALFGSNMRDHFLLFIFFSFSSPTSSEITTTSSASPPASLSGVTGREISTSSADSLSPGTSGSSITSGGGASLASVASEISGTASASDISIDKPSSPPSSEKAVWKADPKSCHKLGSRLPPAEASEAGLLSSDTGLFRVVGLEMDPDVCLVQFLV
ncbi:hypothetical protein EYF80_048939 [Liparis tanakae]|uniref:Uncharacterized protein n=1 Tax=Liparis tanakae TaxID=230148 RepID=A0A4Z2FIV8_9TELE|nr:hypothetical protein EYF80_048939 [Liparis tanakae]